MPKFAQRLDYESPRKSANVVTTPKGKRESEELESESARSRFDRESDTKESDRVGNARTKGSARRAPVKRD
ncbi:hypothetical protein PV394_29655, partial [Streptomyces sp. NE06-03E]|uniref:hypothetical protein n=3 Tax=Streptomyces TaxID=1883 RepID=UPI0029A01252